MRIFLLASFPTLNFDGTCPLSYEDLLRECAAHLSGADFEELDAVTSSPSSGKSNFGKAWAAALSAWHTFNRTERSKRLPQDQSHATISNVIVSDQLHVDLQNAWQMTDPLLREKALLRALWQWIDSRRRMATFSLEDLIGYALQLQILERRQLWNESHGQSQFQEHTQSFLAPVLEELRNQELSA